MSEAMEIIERKVRELELELENCDARKARAASELSQSENQSRELRERIEEMRAAMRRLEEP